MKTLHATDRPAYYRTVWISDVHLGFSGCNAEFLLDFLHATRCDHLYLVGDIIDVWCMQKRLYWPQEHNDVLRALLGKAKHGTRVVYVPGNHDEVFRAHAGLAFGNLSIRKRVVHTTADGRRFLVMHGDEFDAVVQCSKAVALLGTKAYDWLLRLNAVVNLVRRRFGFSYWSIAAFLKHRVKNAVQYISSFESAVAYEAARQRVDGLICGHIHRAEMTQLNGIWYCNCGDWVESCTALVERHDGTLELIHWSDAQHSLKQVRAAA